MYRRVLLGTVGTTVALAGCTADLTGETTTETVLEHFDGEPVRPECTVESETVVVEHEDDETEEYETAETIPYPDAPAEFDDEAVVEFVEAFENAYVTHDSLCDGPDSGHVLGVYYDVRMTETFDQYDDITVVFLRRASTVSGILHEDGSVSAADPVIEGGVYAVDETGAARTDFENTNTYGSYKGESPAPDPLADGTLVAVFD